LYHFKWLHTIFFRFEFVILAKLKLFLKENGEIHIFDSPFYNSDQIRLAKANTKKYYLELGFPEMTTFYHHHLFKNLGAYRLEYKPVNSIINKLFRLTDKPFYWIIIEKEQE